MKLLLASLGAVAMFVSAGCTASSKSTDAAALTNGQVEQMVRTRLQSDAGVRRLEINVKGDGDHRAVQLSGVAYSERQRTRAVDLAKNVVVPGLAVEDKIDVKPYDVPKDLFDDDMMRDAQADAQKAGDVMGSKTDDAWIHTKIVTKLIANSKTPERKINVDVMDNVVTLRGTVPTDEARSEAERVANAVDGVTRVVNKLQIRKG